MRFIHRSDSRLADQCIPESHNTDPAFIFHIVNQGMKRFPAGLIQIGENHGAALVKYDHIVIFRFSMLDDNRLMQHFRQAADRKGCDDRCQ